MSSLQSINGFNLDSDLVLRIFKDYTILSKNGKNIVLCWIPSHVGISGNEQIDLLLQRGRAMCFVSVTLSVVSLNKVTTRAESFIIVTWASDL